MNNYDEMKAVKTERESIKANEKRLEKERQKHENQAHDQHARHSSNDIQPNINNKEKPKEQEDNSRGAWVNGNAVVNDYYHQRNISNRQDEPKNESPAMQKYREHQVAIKEKMLSQQKEQARIKGKNPEKLDNLKTNSLGHER